MRSTQVKARLRNRRLLVGICSLLLGCASTPHQQFTLGRLFEALFPKAFVPDLLRAAFLNVYAPSRLAELLAG